MCAVWTKVPKVYRRLLQKERLHIALVTTGHPNGIVAGLITQSTRLEPGECPGSTRTASSTKSSRLDVTSQVPQTCKGISCQLGLSCALSSLEFLFCTFSLIGMLVALVFSCKFNGFAGRAFVYSAGLVYPFIEAIRSVGHDYYSQ